MPRPVHRDLARALYRIKQETLSIHQRRRTLRADDVINALTFSVGKTLRAAEILETLHRQCTTLRRNKD